jgi:hypothetical protein
MLEAANRGDRQTAADLLPLVCGGSCVLRSRRRCGADPSRSVSCALIAEWGYDSYGQPLREVLAEAGFPFLRRSVERARRVCLVLSVLPDENTDKSNLQFLTGSISQSNLGRGIHFVKGVTYSTHR